MFVDEPRTDGHEFRLRLFEHLPVIGVLLGGSHPYGGRVEAPRIGIGHGDDLRRGYIQPNRVQPMPIIAPPRMPNHPHAIPLAAVPSAADERWTCDRSRGGGRSG